MHPSGQSALTGYLPYVHVKPHINIHRNNMGLVNIVFKLQFTIHVQYGISQKYTTVMKHMHKYPMLVQSQNISYAQKAL